MKRSIKRYEKRIYRYAKGACDHEAGHIIQRHSQKKEKFNTASAVVAGITWMTILVVARQKFQWSDTKMLVSYPFIGAMSFGTQFLLTQALSRKYEWDADACIRNKPKILRAMGDEWVHNSTFHGQYSQFNNRFLNLVNRHPPFPARVQAVYARAEKLEKRSKG